MTIWGICWGGFLGLLLAIWSGAVSVMQGIFFGLLLGFVFALTLRRALHREWLLWQQQGSGEALNKELDTALGVGAAAHAPTAHAPAAQQQPIPMPKKRRLLAAGVDQSTGAVDTQAQLAVTQARLPEPLMASKGHSHTPQSSTPPSAFQQVWAAAQSWFTGGNTVVRLGLLLLFIGLAFLAKYAAEAGLFPPALRMSLIALVGLVLFSAGGVLRRKWLGSADDAVAKRPLAYAHLLQGAGIGVLYLTVFAAMRLYALLPMVWALSFLVAIAALAAVIALLQNTMSMAFIGFLGGFAAPILVSSGGGNYQALFSYYLLLDVAIVAIAWLRAWRPLNLLGFVATFGVMGWWVASAYTPDMYAGVQPFVLGFFVLFVLAALFYALRHGLPARRAVDASLLFGPPLAAMGIQLKLVQGMEYAGAFSALIASALYLALAAWMQGRAQAADEPQAQQGARWLGQSYWALGLLFLTLAVPLALDAQWTAAIWALEGAAVYHLGLRQGQWFARAMGLALQPLAWLAFAEQSAGSGDVGNVLHPQLLGYLCLAAGAWILVAGLQAKARFAQGIAVADALLQGASSLLARVLAQIEGWAAAPLFLVGCVYWAIGGYEQIALRQLMPDGDSYPWIIYDARPHALLLFSALSAFALHHWALPQRRYSLPVAALPAWMLLPFMLLILAFDSFDLDIFTQMGGWWIWPLALGLWLLMLRRLDGSAQDGVRKTAWSWAHGGQVLLACGLLANALWWAVEEAQLWHTAWASVVFVVAGTAVLAYLSRSAHMDALAAANETDEVKAANEAQTSRYAAWPWQPYARVYLVPAAGLLAWVLGWGAVLLALTSRGYAAPLPYIPLLNPTDVSVAAALLVLVLYRSRLAQVREDDVDAKLPRWEGITLGLAGFVWINTIWLRCVHHFWGVYWDDEALFDSFVTQAGYSILWTLLALGAMLLAHRRAQRGLWLVGAGLLALTVLKLVFIDLSNSGGAERIISFIGVGVLMLVLGYWAPLPPKNISLNLDEKA